MSRVALRGIEILQLLAHASEPLAVSEVCRQTGLKRATAYRLVQTMEEEGWLRRVGRPSKFIVGLRTLELGLAPLSMNYPREVLLGYAADLSQSANVRTAIGFYEDGEVLYTDTLEVGGGGRVTVSATGRRLPAACTAAGKILLACRPDDEIDRVVAKGLPRYQAGTRTDPLEIRADIKATRDRGYSIAYSEYTEDAGGVGVAVFDRSRAAVGSIIVVVSEPVTETFLSRYVPPLRATARRASLELGYRPEDRPILA
jgi:IclR family transcriptional regulator, KDG regulon repressor